MQIDLAAAVARQVKRAEDLADEAAADVEQGFAARASALNVLSSMLKELTKTQADLVNMASILRTERIIIETVKEHLTELELTQLIDKLEIKLADPNA